MFENNYFKKEVWEVCGLETVQNKIICPFIGISVEPEEQLFIRMTVLKSIFFNSRRFLLNLDQYAAIWNFDVQMNTNYNKKSYLQNLQVIHVPEFALVFL